MSTGAMLELDLGSRNELSLPPRSSQSRESIRTVGSYYHSTCTIHANGTTDMCLEVKARQRVPNPDRRRGQIEVLLELNPKVK